MFSIWKRVLVLNGNLHQHQSTMEKKPFQWNRDRDLFLKSCGISVRKTRTCGLGGQDNRLTMSLTPAPGLDGSGEP